MYIVIETHGGAEYACIVTNEDGSNKVFEHHPEALEEANKCKAGVIVRVY